MKLINAYKKFKKGNKEIVILDDVTIDFEIGKFYIIIGESGSGKSSLINILGLLDTLDKGSLIFDTEDVTKYKDKKLSKLRLERVGLVFQDYYLNPRLTSKENVLIATYINDLIEPSKRDELVDNTLQYLNLTDRANHYPDELSGGEAQRVCIARAIINNPDYILADEPTGSLDPKNALNVMEMLSKLVKENNKSIIMVTHDYNNIKYADIVYKLENGKLTEVSKYDIYKEYNKEKEL